MIKTHIYCHIPYCKRRCRYCYFTAKFKQQEMTNLSNIDKYVDAIVQDINETDIPDIELQSIVFGGGTPSLLNKDQLKKILDAIHNKLTQRAMKTLKYMAYEVSPDTASYSVLKNFRDAGFNRISIGVQSFDNNELKILGRPYTGQKVQAVMDDIRSLNYNLINVDLLLAIPGQTKKTIINSVRKAIAMKPEHLSVSLFYKSYPGGKEFVEDCKKQGYKIIDLDKKIEVYKEICDMIRNAGYIRVDNTVFSLPGYIYEYEKDSICGTESVLAFGPGSSGYWNGSIRYTPPNIDKYIVKPSSTYKDISVKTNAFATIWGHLNAFGYIKEDEIIKNFNLTIKQIVEQDDSVKRLISSLEKYDLFEEHNNSYNIKENLIDKAIVVMHSIKDDWGYKLITAPDNIEELNK